MKEKSFIKETSLKNTVVNHSAPRNSLVYTTWIARGIFFCLCVYFRPKKVKWRDTMWASRSEMRQKCKTLRWIRPDPIKVFGLLEKGQNVTPSPSADLKTGWGYSNDVVQTNQMCRATQLYFLGTEAAPIFSTRCTASKVKPGLYMILNQFWVHIRSAIGGYKFSASSKLIFIIGYF